MKFALSLALGLMLATPALAQEAAMPSDADIAKILSDRIGRDQANVGIAVAVIEGGETRYVSAGTYGIDDTTPVDQNTVFEAGSITKVFTNLLLAKLVVDGKIDLDAPITNYLPEGTVVPQGDGKPISAFDLATHTSGLVGLPEAITGRGADDPYTGFGKAALLEWIAGQTLAHPVGANFVYSNSGTALLGQAIEHVAGKSYADLVKDEIFTPLGMNASSLSLTGTTPPKLPNGYNQARETVPHWDFDAYAPAGALLTTTTDLAKFIAAATGAVQTPLAPAFETMLGRTRPIGEQLSIGLGWLITNTGQSDIVWHNGMTGGFASFAGFDRNTGNGVVVLSNMATETGIDDIGMHLLDPALPLQEQPKLRTAVALDAGTLPNYVGTYELSPGLTLTVSAEGETLYAQLTGQDRFQIFPESETDFFYKIVDAQITFTLEGGKATGLVLHQHGQDLVGKKVE